ncbi:MAG TPA: DUF4381 domain-containing protein [Rhodanobacteraceae bacterium]
MSASGPALRDIHVPPVSWWPPAIGWWLLAILVLIAIAGGAILVVRARRRAQPRRAVRRELDALAARFARDRNPHALAAGLSKLLRRIALMIEPAAAAKDAAGWRAFIEQRVPGAFGDAQLGALLEAPYRAHPDFDAEALLAAARTWCKRALRGDLRTHP